MKQKVIIALKLLTYLHAPAKAAPPESYAVANYALSNTTRVVASRRSRARTYGFTRAEALRTGGIAYAARESLHHALCRARHLMHRCRRMWR